MGDKFSCTTGNLDPMIVSFVEYRIRSAKILVVSKTSCTACTQAKELLRSLVSRTGISPTIIEVDQYKLQCTKGVINYLAAQTGIRTVPQIYINGRFVGGNDAVQRLHLEGRLVPLILQSTKASTSITSANKASGYGHWSTTTTTTPLRVSTFQTDLAPHHTFEKLMPKTTTISMFNNDMKSDDFSESRFGALSPSRSHSSFTSQGYQSTQSSSFMEKESIIIPHRRRSNIAISPIVTAKKNTFYDRSPSFLSTDPSEPSRSSPTSSSSSYQPWGTAKPIVKSSQYMSDEQILAQKSIPVANSSRSSWMRPNQWFTNSRKAFSTTTSAIPSRQSIVIEEPISKGTSGWIYINPKVV